MTTENPTPEAIPERTRTDATLSAIALTIALVAALAAGALLGLAALGGLFDRPRPGEPAPVEEPVPPDEAGPPVR